MMSHAKLYSYFYDAQEGELYVACLILVIVLTDTRLESIRSWCSFMGGNADERLPLYNITTDSENDDLLISSVDLWNKTTFRSAPPPALHETVCALVEISSLLEVWRVCVVMRGMETG